MKAPEECNILMDSFVPFLQAGHKIGKVGIEIYVFLMHIQINVPI